jgi:hypothetical protein
MTPEEEREAHRRIKETEENKYTFKARFVRVALTFQEARRRGVGVDRLVYK